MSEDTSEEREHEAPPDAGDEGDEVPELAPEDEAAVRALLKRSFDIGAKDHAPPPDAALVRGFQERVRRRSKGKFYGDGWSTAQSRVSVALVAALMLLIAALVYLAMGPVGVSP